MVETGGMPPDVPLKCLHCNRSFVPDCRHRQDQRYCRKPQCKRARQAASLQRWRQKPENREFWRGAWNVERVREWRAEHPRYWQGHKRQRVVALQNAMKPVQMPLLEVDKPVSEKNGATKRIPTLLEEQSPVVVGLIAHLTGSTLQNAIGEMAVRLFETGRAVMGPVSNHENRKTNPEHPAAPAHAGGLWLDRSSVGP